MNILDIKMQPNDAGAETVKDYFKALLTQIWEQGESFSGKRPFGNGGWQWELLDALTSAGVAADEHVASQLIYDAIDSI